MENVNVSEDDMLLEAAIRKSLEEDNGIEQEKEEDVVMEDFWSENEKDIANPYSDYEVVITEDVEGWSVTFKVSKYQIAHISRKFREMIEKTPEPRISMTVQSRPKLFTYNLFLTLLHEVEFVEKFKWEAHYKDILALIHEHSAFLALISFIKSLKKSITSKSINLDEKFILDIVYYCINQIDEWKKERTHLGNEATNEPRTEAFLKVEKLASKIVFIKFKNFNSSVLNPQFNDMPYVIMYRYLQKPFEVDSENTLFYGIVLWSMKRISQKNNNKEIDIQKEILELLRLCDYISMTKRYILDQLVIVIDKYKEKGLISVYKYLFDRRKVSMEYLVGGKQWFEKFKCKESSVKKVSRVYKKDKLQFIFANIKILYRNGKVKEKEIYLGFTWTYKFTRKKDTTDLFEGNLFCRNEIRDGKNEEMISVDKTVLSVEIENAVSTFTKDGSKGHILKSSELGEGPLKITVNLDQKILEET
jgi:hypothetical protein